MSEHEPFIKTPQQLITVVALSFVVPVLIIVLLVTYVTSGPRTGAGTQGMSAEAIEARIRPVAGFRLAAADGPKVPRPPEEVYKAQCAACHDAGVAGAPRTGDEAGWVERIKTGYEAMLTSVIKGKGAMAAQGGGEYSDLELGRAVVYMANRSGGKLEEPREATAEAAPAAAAAAPAARAPSAEPAPAVAAPAAAAPAPAPVATPAPPAPAAAAPAAAPAAPAAEAPAAPAAAASVAQVASPASGAAAEAGKKIYGSACVACHVAGVAGAPKFGDKAAWAPLIAQGIDALTASVIKGKGAMPPRGAAGGASDADLRAAVEYMVAAAQ